MSQQSAFLWREVTVRRPLTEADAIARIRRLADDPAQPRVVVELRGEDGRVRMLLGARADQLPHLLTSLDAHAEKATHRTDIEVARSLRVRPLSRAFADGDLVVTVPELYRAASLARVGEVIVLQLILGPRIRGRTATTQDAQTSAVRSWFGMTDQPERLVSEQIRQKLHEPGFAAVVRVGVAAREEGRRRGLLTGALQALHRLEAPGVRLQLVPSSVVAFNRAASPWGWPLRLSVSEATALSGLPIGGELAGLPPLHPVQLAPSSTAESAENNLTLAEATAPGNTQPISVSDDAVLRSIHLLGPVGVGKSDVTAQLVVQWVNQGKAAVVLEPKVDLSNSIASRLGPDHRDRVVYFDLFSEQGAIGLNPLRLNGRSPEVVVDSLVSIFSSVLSDVIGVTTRDLLNAALLSLVRYPGATLLMLPVLLSTPKFRKKVVGNVADDVFLQAYWAEFEGKSEQARAQLVAPVLVRLRQLLLRPSFRRCLGQAEPKFDIRQVFGDEKRVLLAPLPKALLGKQGVALLGSLLLHEVFGAINERAVIPIEKRHPVMVAVDEWHHFVHGTQDFAEALTLFRGYGAGFVLCNQVMAQLSRELREVVNGTVRSHVYFQLGPDDAASVARHSSDLEAIDLMSLEQFHVYAALYARGKTQPFVSGRTIALPKPLVDVADLQVASHRRYGADPEELDRTVAELYGGGTTTGDEGRPPPGIGRRPPTQTSKQETSSS